MTRGFVPADAQAVALGAEGVGLFRTEFLFLSSAQAPTVEQQREAYTQLLQAFPGKKVVVRVLDAGADKPLAFADLGPEENPALGRRGLRLSAEIPELLDSQLDTLEELQADERGARVDVAPPLDEVVDAALAAVRRG